MSYYPRQGFSLEADQLYHDADDILNTDCIRLESQQMNLLNGRENHFFIVLNHLLLYLEGFKSNEFGWVVKHDETSMIENNTVSIFVLSDMNFSSFSTEGLSLLSEVLWQYIALGSVHLCYIFRYNLRCQPT